MQKPSNVVPISVGYAGLDPEHFTISVGSIPFRFRMGPDGRSTPIGPARLIDFPGTHGRKALAKSAPGSDECPDRGGRRVRRTQMKTFTIDNETSNITLHRTVQEAEVVPNAECFHNEAGLAKLAANWPGARLVDIWNSLPGATPVKKFKDRATAVSRIWKAIQTLGGATPVAEVPALGPDDAPVIELLEAAPVPAQETSETAQPEPVVPESMEPAVARPVAPQALHVAPERALAKNKATRRKKAPKAPTNASVPRAESKTNQVIGMLKRQGGTTLEEIMTAMGWQSHTTRAMLSAGGSLTKKHGLAIVTEKIGVKRTYSIKA
jgi:hypothetical protein